MTRSAGTPACRVHTRVDNLWEKLKTRCPHERGHGRQECLRYIVIVALLLASCGEKPASLEDLNTRTVTLPDNTRILAEVKITPQEMSRGLMFRESLPPDRGMLFIHNTPGTYSYWMYQCKIPLDIIWMNSNRRVVEISADTPPCKAHAADCPAYGGHRQSQFVLELGGGEAKRHGVIEGQTISF